MVAISDLPANVQAMVARVTARDPHATEFLQAFEEVAITLAPVFAADEEQLEIFERLTEPERLIQFRVSWQDDNGKIQYNRGFRVQYSSALGPYKGGLRFHPSVNKSILSFLGFEQIFKNALTGLPMGGGKGGSDFNPKGKSDAEIMRFCQSFMTELFRHIGPNTDVPAGDIGVGGREIGYMFGQYKRLANEFTATLTGRGHGWGGSLIRPEATGYGAVYFLGHMLENEGLSFEDQPALVSGSGNVAQYASEKLLEKGAKVMSLSDSSGTVIFKNGLTTEALAAVMEIKNVKRARLHTVVDTEAGKAAGAEYHEGKKPWGLVEATLALPCATQNEILIGDAEALIAKGLKAVSEGANMPTTNEAIDLLKASGVVVGVAKAANAGGVAVSGLEMAQGAQREFWTREQVDDRLKAIMAGIFAQCQEAATTVDLPANDYQAGANIAGFLRVAKAMKAFGCI